MINKLVLLINAQMDMIIMTIIHTIVQLITIIVVKSKKNVKILIVLITIKLLIKLQIIFHKITVVL